MLVVNTEEQEFQQLVPACPGTQNVLLLLEDVRV